MLSTNASGQLPDPGQPFGKFTVCADNNVKFAQQTNVVNDVINGTTVNLPLGSGTSGKCT